MDTQIFKSYCEMMGKEIKQKTLLAAVVKDGNNYKVLESPLLSSLESSMEKKMARDFPDVEKTKEAFAEFLNGLNGDAGSSGKPMEVRTLEYPLAPSEWDELSPADFLDTNTWNFPAEDVYIRNWGDETVVVTTSGDTCVRILPGDGAVFSSGVASGPCGQDISGWTGDLCPSVPLIRDYKRPEKIREAAAEMELTEEETCELIGLGVMPDTSEEICAPEEFVSNCLYGEYSLPLDIGPYIDYEGYARRLLADRSDWMLLSSGRIVPVRDDQEF